MPVLLLVALTTTVTWLPATLALTAREDTAGCVVTVAVGLPKGSATSITAVCPTVYLKKAGLSFRGHARRGFKRDNEI
jgi:hypothetical protein